VSQYFKKELSVRKAFFLIPIALLPILIYFVCVWFDIDIIKLPTALKVIGVGGVLVFCYFINRLAVDVNKTADGNSFFLFVKNPIRFAELYVCNWRQFTCLVLGHILICFLLFLSVSKYNLQGIFFKATFAIALVFGNIVMPFLYLYLVRALMQDKKINRTT